ncbi:hypothetical protein DS893_07820 [Vibrionales bacterium C3R12]|uniref:hypothetical protein n=2 Tax=Vibrio TaxID=662 RepID=UPI000DEAD81E|nr:hypothetical protein [Vibrio sp. 03-59-1]NOH84041.1 hypothetical protein [Vibrio sp. 03-59-1]RBW65726.1 hypothetical protein DS893_07820 [Vibrionales bacterium C3R12]
MHYMSLKLDNAALELVGDLVKELDNDDGWIKMTARIAAQIDSTLSSSDYVGVVLWFSESDYIEQEIVYR